MDVLGFSIKMGLIVMVVVIPIVFTRKGYGFFRVNLICIPLIFLFVIMIAYWPHFYDSFRLELMDFDFEGMNDVERARNVAPELRDEATRLYWSNMGIGWPLKAIFGMVFALPITSIVWWLRHLTKRKSQ